MVVEIKEYGSAEDIAETLDKEISDTKSMLGVQISNVVSGVVRFKSVGSTRYSVTPKEGYKTK